MQELFNPINENGNRDQKDEPLVIAALSGNQQALEELISRHQGWIYNMAVRMLWNPQDAQDATQEILLKIVTHLSSFRRESAFRTWAYRIVCNHVLNCRRSKTEQIVKSFACYGSALDQTPEADFPEKADDLDAGLLMEEVKIACIMGMLLCLDREQRLVFVLGEVFESPDTVGAELLDITRDNFRQQLSRGRRQLYGFLRGKCGLANPANPCRCARKTKGFIKAGIVDPQQLQFTTAYRHEVELSAEQRSHDLQDRVDTYYDRLFRGYPLLEPPDMVSYFKELINNQGFRLLLKLNQEVC